MPEVSSQAMLYSSASYVKTAATCSKLLIRHASVVLLHTAPFSLIESMIKCTVLRYSYLFMFIHELQSAIVSKLFMWRHVTKELIN